MGAYLLRRLLLVIPTLFGIIAINFVVVQFAPGGPVEQMVAELKGHGGVTGRMTGAGASEAMPAGNGSYRGARGLDPHMIADIRKMFGFDKPAPERFVLMLRGYLTFDLGRSFFRDKPVLQLIEEKMPVSISIGLWSTLLVYFVSIPLGIAKAVHDGSRFDVISSAAVLIGYAVPGFLFAILLVVLFAGGSFVQWFPLRGLHSMGSESWSMPARIVDYLWHMVLPTVALVAGGFASLTVLTKNCFLEEIRKQYVVTARAKGAGEQRILYRHVFRNAMLLIIAGFPSAFIGILFSSALLVEIIFSLDGLGLLGFRGGHPARLSGDVRHPVCVYPAWPADADRRRPAVHGGRSAHRFRGEAIVQLSPLTRRRLAIFRAHRRGYWSLWIFLALFGLSLFAEFLANDRPLLIRFDGHWYVPVLQDYSEDTFGADFMPTEADYTEPDVQAAINAHGWMIWPPIRYSYDTVVKRPSTPAPSPPDRKNLLGTDDQARDVLARVIYGFRISVLFGFTLTAISSVIGIAAGAIQGFRGGLVDLLFQRFIEIWSGMPQLYLLIILASIITPSFWILLVFLLLFSWMNLTGVVRAEFLRGRNLDYVRAAKALGVSDVAVMWRHILPNAMVATLTFLPFTLSGSVTILASLDFLGFGLPPGSPSLGELVSQGKNNLQAPWLGITAFVVLGGLLTLLVFIGEAVRDAFDPRKTPRIGSRK